MKKNSLLIIFSVLLTYGGLFAQTEAQRQEIISNYDLEKLSALQSEISERENLSYQRALEKANLMGWEKRIEMPNGGVAVLIGLKENGNPIYNTTFNREGAITTRTDKVNTGGGAGLDLNGENMLLGLWEVFGVNVGHPLLEGRLTQIDTPSELDNHSTHVSGTMIGTGSLNSGSTKGMAPLAEIIAYDSFSAGGEMAAAAANGLLVSNHSYGIGLEFLELWELGFYGSYARDLDNILYNAPYFTSVWAAGNDRNSGFNTADGGYDYLTASQTAKNSIVVAATFEVLNYTGPNSVSMSAFSSWGPTDDGRIKPDISAKGVQMRSSVGTSSYANLSGTSMASPNVSGSLILLQQHYNNINAVYMRSATLRGLALHTADEAGSNPGPDYRFGWGLLNTERAAEAITNDGSTSIILEEEIKDGEVYTFSVQADGINDLMVSVTWLDPRGNALPGGPANEDDPTPSLINDLDLRVSQDGGATFMPWKLDVSNFSAAATTGDNIVDNIEKIEIAGATGEYIIQVSHKGNLVNSKQEFSLIVTGVDREDFNVSSHNGIIKSCAEEESVVFDLDLFFSDGFSDTINFSVTDLPTGVTGSISPNSLNTEGTVELTLIDFQALAIGDYTFKVVAEGNSETINTYLTLSIVDEMNFEQVQLLEPGNNFQNRPIDLTFDWTDGNIFVDSYDFELALDETFTNIVESETLTESTLEILGLQNETTYYWRVRATNDCEDGPYSLVYNFRTRASLGVNDQIIEGLAIYPNPTTNVLNLQANTSITEIKIVNVLGQVLISKTSNLSISQIDVSELSTGNYFISVTSENKTKVLQFLKN